MERVQFYPNTLLKTALDNDSKVKGVSVSALVVEILLEYYGLIPKNTLSLEQTTEQVFLEVKEYIETLNSNMEFDLLIASKTFKNIEMVSKGKPSTNRAYVGKKFAKSIGKEPFLNVGRVYVNGKLKKSVNNATIYKVK